MFFKSEGQLDLNMSSYKLVGYVPGAGSGNAFWRLKNEMSYFKEIISVSDQKR